MQLDHLYSILQQDCHISFTKPVLVGVSGGPDSLCLLDWMARLGFPLIAAHLNHRLRPEAAQDAGFVKDFAASHQIPFVHQEIDVAAYADEYQLTIEEAARKVRYRFLFDQAEHYGAQAVAVAHTADDQVETILMHLLRGAGLAGLRGMAYHTLPNPWSQAVPLVRPLLAVWRADVLEYCARYGLAPVFDRSNLDTTFYRNRLRHELIPILERYNPQVRQRLWRTARSLADDFSALETLVEAAWQECAPTVLHQALALDRAAILAHPVGVQRHLLRRAIGHLRPGLRDIDFDMVEAGLEFLRMPTRTGQRDLGAGLRVWIEGQRCWLAEWTEDISTDDHPHLIRSLALTIPGQVDLPGGWSLSAEKVVAPADEFLNTHDPYQCWVVVGGDELNIRSRRPGDRLAPLGMAGRSLKLSDFWINRKLPRRLRDAWPLVCAGDEIVWVPGFGLSHSFRVTPEALQVVHLRLARLSDFAIPD